MSIEVVAKSCSSIFPNYAYTLQSGTDTISTYIPINICPTLQSLLVLKFPCVKMNSALSSWHTLPKTSKNSLKKCTSVHDIYPHHLRCQKELDEFLQSSNVFCSLNVFHQRSQYLLFKTTTIETYAGETTVSECKLM